MIEGRHINIAAVVIAAAALIFAVIFTYFQSILPVATFSPISEKQYESKLFKKDSLLKVDIIISEDNWNDLVANAVNEEYYLCDVKINGETFANVGIRVKGNNSVTEISEAGSDRYSLKIEFDHYVSGMSCYGLDKLVLNNCYSDVTYMKEYLAYDMFAFLGADASLYSFASVSVNGENRGLYLALESVEESFAERNYGSNYGELYKSADWVYIDDKISSYDTIWDSALFKSGKNDYKRVITALKKISEGEDPDKYIDVDAVLKYLAVNTFVANLDSSGNMSYSNYMYENNGLLSIIPWHYNTAFGGLQSGDAASVINYPIDTPISGVDESGQPLFMKLLEVDKYKEIYRSYLSKLTDEYIGGGVFSGTYATLRNLIDDEVKNDAASFYTYDEYNKAAGSLEQIINLRAQSVADQLDGSIP